MQMGRNPIIILPSGKMITAGQQHGCLKLPAMKAICRKFTRIMTTMQHRAMYIAGMICGTVCSVF